ncbi:MAG: deoxyuridine 5'-triphosphate nucleotidohydrolase [Candidatus Omnitrophica bacterium]|nr:deoxyuridine 5'-triphosphate nucleotidohydrolase [Candidatus Omnitrophota bacterium]MBU4346843.1 deoxyuridine 5'-triphosphate nucleotidohydrolase [Candidatus Omnitrophota bacterium]MBU4472679.1 deoxyuridine 5'-triphosphate nucleotidohydrolase [Candidatus Omnitrophota bacterium]MCG2706718.1 deoxyuridine 5'-triphosphate nucleotidohydrolase [Candidatus Omnitrophota bacterium]
MLNREDILSLIKGKNLLEGYIDLDVQLTPNGFDLTVASIFEFDKPGALDFSNKERELPGGREIIPRKKNPEDKFGWWNLKTGAYKIRTNEIINLPNDLVALAFSRTSLLRMGAFTQHGVWDAGFKGRSEFILLVDNPGGIKIKQNARIVQLIFIKINHTEQGYQGIYQNQR